jgi:hypothetical protein
MIAQSPAVAESRGALNAVLSDPNGDPAVRAAAVRDYVAKQTIEQQRLAPGAPVRIVPNAYIDDLNRAFGATAVPGASLTLLGQVEAERQRWGDAWLRQLDKTAEPVVRVISKPGVNPAAAQQLAELAPISFETIAKDHSDEKRAAIRREVLSAIMPLAATYDGQADGRRAFDDYRGQAEKLAARYVTRGMDTRAAAVRAYAELVLHSYDMRDTFRVPKTAGVSADDI